MLLQKDSDEKHQEPFELHGFRYSRECKYLFLWQQLLLSAYLHHGQLTNNLVKYLHLIIMKMCKIYNKTIIMFKYLVYQEISLFLDL